MVQEKEQQLKSKISEELRQNKGELINDGVSAAKKSIDKRLSENEGINDSSGTRDVSSAMGKFKNADQQWLGQLKDKKLPTIDSVLTKDSSFSKKYNERKKELQKLQKEIDSTEKKMRLLAKTVQDSINRIKTEINKIKSKDSLYAFMKRNNISKDSLTKAQHFLLSVKKIGIGRTWIDYSELTVKNISLTGANVELNPGRFYVAFAAGKANYRFRDFIYKSSDKLPSQQLYLVRAGIGKTDRSNIIATFYNGKKSLLNYAQVSGISPLQKIMGVSIEGKLLIDKNNYMVAEVAKSSYISNGAVVPPSSELVNKVFNLKTHTNEAYSIKLFSQLPSTDTRFTGYYRKTGENFQSFNLYTTNANQDAWMARVNQSLWKKRFILDAAIRKNDFVSPVAVQSFTSQMIFKSLQATLRIPKYPFVSVGYYPSSQLSLINGNVLSESQYNTLNTMVSHNYSLKTISMNSNILFTRFYNNSKDTGFIYYNASNISFNHSVFLPRISFQTTVAIANQKLLHLFTLEQQLNYQLEKHCTITCGLKWNRLNYQENLFGSNAALNLYLKDIGTFQFGYDKTYIPANGRSLMPVDMGRINFYKEF